MSAEWGNGGSYLFLAPISPAKDFNLVQYYGTEILQKTVKKDQALSERWYNAIQKKSFNTRNQIHINTFELLR